MRNVITLLLSISLCATGYAQSDALSVNAGMQLTYNRYTTGPGGTEPMPIGYFLGIDKTYEGSRWGWGVDYGYIDGQNTYLNDWAYPAGSASLPGLSYGRINNVDLRGMYFLVPPSRFYSLSLSMGVSFSFVHFRYPHIPIESARPSNQESDHFFLPLLVNSIDQRFMLYKGLDLFLRMHYKLSFVTSREYLIGVFKDNGLGGHYFSGYTMEPGPDNWYGLYLGMGYRF